MEARAQERHEFCPGRDVAKLNSLKLVLSRKPPYIRLVDIDLQRQVDGLKQANEELRARIVAAQREKASAQSQAEALRSEKDSLRDRVASLKRSVEAQRRAREALQAKVQELREENEALREASK